MIQIQHVSKSFGSFRAIDNLSLSIGQNEYVALLGPNGAGKTTLIEMIEGLQRPDRGQITLLGKTWRNHPRYLRSILGISLQETKFVDKLTVRETLDLFGSFYGLPKTRSEQVLHVTNLEEKRDAYTQNLSGGQRQRLALGIALLNQPQLLLLDEPTTGLDPNARRELWDILMQLKQNRKTTLILTTHYMEEAQYLCDRIVILDRGRILADGTLGELLSSFAAGELVEFETRTAVPEQRLANLPGLLDLRWQAAEHKGVLTVANITEALPTLLATFRQYNTEVVTLECRRKTLDDLFVAMTGRRLDE